MSKIKLSPKKLVGTELISVKMIGLGKIKLKEFEIRNLPFPDEKRWKELALK
jgi:hypothetical protein